MYTLYFYCSPVYKNRVTRKLQKKGFNCKSLGFEAQLFSSQTQIQRDVLLICIE